MRRFELLLFSTHSSFIRDAVAGGVAGVIVDWERRGKSARQAGADTQISVDTRDDLARVRQASEVRLFCRLDPVDEETPEQVEAALQGGADELLIPMVRNEEEVGAVLRTVAGRCRVGILVETRDALERLGVLARLPLSRVYVGLNDLAIERGTPSLFTALVDGTVERVRHAFDVPVGVGGLTLPERGAPIPSRLLIGEMVRLGCEFSFLRRSFHRDVAGAAVGDAVRAILAAVDAAAGRSAEQVEADRRELGIAVAEWPASPVPVS